MKGYIFGYYSHLTYSTFSKFPNLYGKSRFLYSTAKQKGEFDNREQIKARREVDNVVEGNYDQQQ